MMKTVDFKCLIEESIDRHQDDITAIAKKIYDNPEMGYKETYATM